MDPCAVPWRSRGFARHVRPIGATGGKFAMFRMFPPMLPHCSCGDYLCIIRAGWVEILPVFIPGCDPLAVDLRWWRWRVTRGTRTDTGRCEYKYLCGGRDAQIFITTPVRACLRTIRSGSHGAGIQTSPELGLALTRTKSFSGLIGKRKGRVTCFEYHYYANSELLLHARS